MRAGLLREGESFRTCPLHFFRFSSDDRAAYYLGLVGDEINIQYVRSWREFFTLIQRYFWVITHNSIKFKVFRCAS